MSARDEALAAYEATQSDRIAAAKAALIAVLGDPSGVFSAMTVEYDADGVVVFTDGDLHLSVRDDRVDLVEFRDGDTAPTQLEQIDSLAHLGKVLPGLDPVDENAAPAYPAWNPGGVDYAVGERVTYNGAVYEVIQAHTSQAAWTPDATPSLWTKVA